MHPARNVSFRHLLMDDAAARRHPLNVAGRDGTACAHAIAVLNSPRQDIRDGFDPAMRVPREPSQIILGNVVAEIVQEKEWIEVGCIAESESAAKMHASAFERRLGLDESLNGSNGHFGLLDAKIYPVISGGAKFTVHFRGLIVNQQSLHARGPGISALQWRFATGKRDRSSVSASSEKRASPKLF